MGGDSITALAEYQDAHRNGHRPAGVEVPAGELVKRMSAVSSRTIKWAWNGRLALGYLTVQTGEEGLGKSVFAAWLAARATRGELEGVWRGNPVDVLIVGTEDGLEDTWKPRLALAGADLERVASFNLDALPIGWDIRDGIGSLRQAVAETDAKLLVFDALLDHLPPAAGGENINSPTFVRSALSPLKNLVKELGIVAVISLHPPKARGNAFRDLVQASQAFSAIPRMGLFFGWHPDDAEDDPDRRRVLVRGKGNLGRNPGALEFRVAGRDYLHDDGEVQEREVVEDVNPCDVTLSQLTARSRSGTDDVSKAEQASEILRDRLADGEWHPVAPIREALDALDLESNSVVYRARQLADVETRKAPGSAHGGWEWRIRSKSPTPPISEKTDPWTKNTSNPQQPREGSKIPPLVTTDSSNGERRGALQPPECGHRARWWRLPAGQIWICELCHPAPPTALVAWNDEPGVAA
jgi:AAA domain